MFTAVFSRTATGPLHYSKNGIDIFIKFTDILGSQIQESFTTQYIYGVKTWIDSLISHLLEDINFLEPG
jgi:hypothetical protein